MSNTNNRRKLGYKIKGLREKNGLSQEAVATYLGVGKDQVDAIEKNKGHISTVLLERTCELFGCTFKDLIDQDNPKAIEYTQPLSEYIDDLPVIAAINRIAINLLEMQRIQIAGDQFNNDFE